MKLTIDTPKGEITVIPATNLIHPGVYIEINGVQVALIEYDSIDQKHAVRVWDGEQEDCVFKQEIKPPLGAGESTYIQGIIEDIQQTQESKGIELTDEQILKVAHIVSSKYDYSGYDEYISETIDEEIHREAE